MNTMRTNARGRRTPQPSREPVERISAIDVEAAEASNNADFARDYESPATMSETLGLADTTVARTAINFPDLRAEYAELLAEMAVRRDRLAQADGIVNAIVANRARYEAVAGTTRVPWYVVAVIHSMEASLNFTRHLHNGDPLTARTVQVPAGRPPQGRPPFAWEVSAADALTFDGIANNNDWSIERIAYLLEGFNGWGYRRYHPEVKSPYLWSFSNHYTAGKYVADGRWSATAVSQQCGAMVLLNRLQALGHVNLSPQGALHAAPGADAVPTGERSDGEPSPDGSFEDDREMTASFAGARVVALRTGEEPKPVPAGAPFPFAESPAPVGTRRWPVQTDHPRGREVAYETVNGGFVGERSRRFLTLRNGGARYHVAIDLYAYRNDRVVACEDGRIVAYYPFYQSSAGDMSYALLIEHAGFVINYGEVAEGAPAEFGWQVGASVRADQVIAKISGTSMLHFETYVRGTRASQRWLVNGPRPTALLNPTRYLLSLP